MRRASFNARPSLKRVAPLGPPSCFPPSPSPSALGSKRHAGRSPCSRASRFPVGGASTVLTFVQSLLLKPPPDHRNGMANCHPSWAVPPRGLAPMARAPTGGELNNAGEPLRFGTWNNATGTVFSPLVQHGPVGCPKCHRIVHQRAAARQELTSAEP